MAKKSIQSVEPNIADLVNGWLKSYKLSYKLEQESLNTEIDKALDDYYSKNGGSGGNRPDAKLLLQDSSLNYYPILIEYKGYKDKLVKLDEQGQVENKNSKNEPNFKNINSYAVNGAIHYANAILHHTHYTDIIAIGITGYKDDFGKLQHQIGVYYVSKDNFGVGQKVREYDDLSFLAPANFEAFIAQIKTLNLSQEDIDRIKAQREQEIAKSLSKLNNDIFINEPGLSETDRLYLVAASIMATLGIPNKVSPLEKSELKSLSEKGNTDGDILLRKIIAFLSAKELPEEKRNMIIRTLKNTITNDSINKVENGESQLKRVFTKIVDDLGIYYKIGLTTDFTGKLFNEMYSWLGWAKDKLNDVVLTPSYVATLLAKLARVHKDSFVWDFATGSAGLLVAAMNEMLIDAKQNICSPNELAIKERKIREEQLLGIERLAEIYMLAVLNMILMGDGSSNILHQDSLKEFNGKYEYIKPNEDFPADAFVLNPPYSAKGKGMIFTERALKMMKRGYAAIIIHDKAGSGKAREYNKKILKNNTLLASIKMPEDLFVGKSNVQTYIYVFMVNEPHNINNIVKFIDFSNDGYTRTNRRKASNNLRDTDHAKERYEELVNVVRFGKEKLRYISTSDYFEGHIDPNNGADWNQSAPMDYTPTLADFQTTVADYLMWEVKSSFAYKPDNLTFSETDVSLNKMLQEVKWSKFTIKDLFDISNTLSFNTDVLINGDEYDYITRTSLNQGIKQTTGFVNSENINSAGNWSLGLLQMDFFYRRKPWYAGQFVKKVIPKFDLDDKSILFFTTLLNKLKKSLKAVLVRDVDNVFLNSVIDIPIKDNGEINFEFIHKFISELEAQFIIRLEMLHYKELELYLAISGIRLSDRRKKSMLQEYSKILDCV